MSVYRFHFSEREFYSMDIRADSLDEAIKVLEHAGVCYQNPDHSDYLEGKDIPHEEEDYNNEEQWEVLP